jgi:hypothetical protein
MDDGQPSQSPAAVAIRAKRKRPTLAYLPKRRRLGSGVGLTLEDREGGALRIGDHRDAPDVDLSGRH